jgi:hypothetical protein
MTLLKIPKSLNDAPKLDPSNGRTRLALHEAAHFVVAVRLADASILINRLFAPSTTIRCATSDPETSLSNLRATLFQPVLISLASQAFTFRGFERIETGEGAFSVMQEWRCELVP